MNRNIWIGYDAAEHDACKVAVRSLVDRYRGPGELVVRFVDRMHLEAQDLYLRPTAMRDGRLYDVASAAPMSTQHANARFLIPRLQRGGLALFVDGDVLFRGDVEEIFRLADPRFAVQCVQHGAEHVAGEKKGGHDQALYARKNWSSCVLWNLDHHAHERLTSAMLHGAPGRDLHRFCWLKDSEIGALPAEWNYLVGVSAYMPDPKLVHYTLGLPCVAGYESAPYADEWRRQLAAAPAAKEIATK